MLGQDVDVVDVSGFGSGDAVAVLVRPERLRLQAAPDGAGIVTTRTFLGSVTRVGVLMSEDLTVQIDLGSADAAGFEPGSPVAVGLDGPVLVAAR